MLELAERVRALAGSRSPVEFVELPADDPKQRRPNLDRAAELLDWSPRVDFEEGLKRTIEWFGRS